MDIGKPKISRLLAELIQPIEPEDRRRFIEDAKEAKDMEAFLEKYKTYKKYM
ncbi:hypothetical protein [Phormidium sp. FACHB-1136]|jgi:hypothetical protein|uniref:hypothetical protein n=1 Tax=Phormidium sp. FACHB-1136 TaxID=2692848 RepID=UPI001682D95C|nr:hypothetical protein [Phormidium sp. FACHB-1136]MBD2428247.1 hypothetical protein [Phormidium sp. FACHB-1136]